MSRSSLTKTKSTCEQTGNQVLETAVLHARTILQMPLL